MVLPHPAWGGAFHGTSFAGEGPCIMEDPEGPQAFWPGSPGAVPFALDLRTPAGGDAR
jgi:hypothetical protein